MSGFASRRLLGRTCLAGFVCSRTIRLPLPILFALVVFLPPELWVRVRERGYAGSLPR